MEAETYRHLEELHGILTELHLVKARQRVNPYFYCHAINCVREAIVLERTGKQLAYFATAENYNNLFSS